MKKNAVFNWDDEQQQAMNILKIYLTFTSVLQFINYDENVEDIILATDVSLTEWEVILIQINKKIKKRHLIQYESKL